MKRTIAIGLTVLLDWAMRLYIHPQGCFIANGLSCSFGVYPVLHDRSVPSSFVPVPMSADSPLIFVLLLVVALFAFHDKTSDRVWFHLVCIGMASNGLQLLLTGNVYDWIVVRLAGDFWIMTISDILAMGGVTVLVIKVAWAWIEPLTKKPDLRQAMGRTR